MNIQKPLMYRVRLAWDEKYIIFSTEKLNVKNDNAAKRMARRIAKIGNFPIFEVLAYREGKDLPGRI